MKTTKPSDVTSLPPRFEKRSVTPSACPSRWAIFYPANSNRNSLGRWLCSELGGPTTGEYFNKPLSEIVHVGITAMDVKVVF